MQIYEFDLKCKTQNEISEIFNLGGKHYDKLSNK